MQISLCFRIISFLKKANKLWVGTPGVKPISVKLSMVNMTTELDPVYEKNTLHYHSSGKGDPASPEKCALFSSELQVHCSVCRWCPGFWRRQRVAMLYHCANCVQVGVESYCLPLHRLGIGVIHGVLKGCLAIVIFMNRTSCVLRFGCSPVRKITLIDSY